MVTYTHSLLVALIIWQDQPIHSFRSLLGKLSLNLQSTCRDSELGFLWAYRTGWRNCFICWIANKCFNTKCVYGNICFESCFYYNLIVRFWRVTLNHPETSSEATVIYEKQSKTFTWSNWLRSVHCRRLSGCVRIL